jgi:hypothetical protein
MTLDLATAINPVRIACDYFRIYPPWNFRIDNLRMAGSTIESFDLVTTADAVDQIIHIKHIPGIGHAIVGVEENLTTKFIHGEAA